MMAQATGYLMGGVVGNAYGIKAPFETSFVLFIVAFAYIGVALPDIPREKLALQERAKTEKRTKAAFLGPLKVLLPQRLRLADGQIKKHFGVLLLCCGIFLGVFATGYAPLLIQVYATAAFDFSQKQNGWLLSEFGFVRSIFLIFIFPRLITWGRKRYSSKKPATERLEESADDDVGSVSSLRLAPEVIDTLENEGPELEDLRPANTTNNDGDVHFDLVFLRYSLVVDGVFTSLAAFATRSYHIYLGTAKPVLPTNDKNAEH
ncbi:hypothetical protein VTK73DRAFT_9369 [Phialemonium thermophilum]|uniref:Uncharacterized protein n=1 Tax=Phialemonium thermophilum TaxID=223376 RepID=A0ABR3W2S3_9PEZI